MKKNMGNFDRVFRLLFAVAVAILYFTNTISGTLAIILIVLAGVFTLTSFVGFCPVYAILGTNTCSVKAKQQQ